MPVIPDQNENNVSHDKVEMWQAAFTADTLYLLWDMISLTNLLFQPLLRGLRTLMQTLSQIIYP